MDEHEPQTDEAKSVREQVPADEWAEKGAPDIRDAARERVREILSSHYPDYIDDATDAKLRERFPIALPRDAMRASCGRW